MKKSLIASVLALSAVFSAQAKDIVDTAVGAGSFNTLAAALKAADLIDTLKGKGPFTVFAHHVVGGKVMAADVKAGPVKTVQGSSLMVSTMGGVMVDGAKVTATDIVADNGVIHVIDSVIIPK